MSYIDPETGVITDRGTTQPVEDTGFINKPTWIKGVPNSLVIFALIGLGYFAYKKYKK